jgi:hypothetical protein
MRQARQRQSQVCGVHGRGLSGFGQQVHLWPLSIPDPAVRLISPGRRVFRRVTRCHRPWPGCRAPTNPPSRRARPSRSRIAYPRYAPAVRPAGHGLGAAGGPKGDGRRVLNHHFPRLAHDLEPLQLQQGPGQRPEGGVVVDDQHGLGHRLIVARAEGASHRGYPWFPIPTRQHPSMLRRCRGRTAGPLKELRRLRRGSSPTLGMQESV